MSCGDLHCSRNILITPTEVNNNGLLIVVQSKLSTLNVQLVNTFDENMYSGCRLHIQQDAPISQVKTLSCNYALDDGDHIVTLNRPGGGGMPTGWFFPLLAETVSSRKLKLSDFTIY